MSLNRSDYYMGKLWDSSIGEMLIILDQIENDVELSADEINILAHIIEELIADKRKGELSLINKINGKPENLRQIMENDFGETARYEGEIDLYGVRWKVYTPSSEFSNSKIKKWNYNQHISGILRDTLIGVVPGMFKEYFDYPPWLLGSKYAPDTYFVPLEEIINVAIARGVITGWGYLIDIGIPRLMVDDLRANDLGSIF
jgi:hypothetical protein